MKQFVIGHRDLRCSVPPDRCPSPKPDCKPYPKAEWMKGKPNAKAQDRSTGLQDHHVQGRRPTATRIYGKKQGGKEGRDLLRRKRRSRPRESRKSRK